mmetsp:Transcript_16154/g.26911  ORF Transcript_16154/g.26911 Transcript_16154/m.26911 type:complete len:316 (+) Transcript_16154:32-979(+)
MHATIGLWSLHRADFNTKSAWQLCFSLFFLSNLYTSIKSAPPPPPTLCMSPPPDGTNAGGWTRPRPPSATLRPSPLISASTSRMKLSAPPVGLNTTRNLGHVSGPSLLSGLPALRGHINSGILGTVVTIATPSSGHVMYPRWGNKPGETNEHSLDSLRISTILVNGTSTSKLPIQNRNAPSLRMSTDRTELYQNHATTNRLVRDMVTAVPCAPRGTAATTTKMKMASRMTKRSLKENENGDDAKLRFTLPSSVTYVKLWAMRRGSSGSRCIICWGGAGPFGPRPPGEPWAAASCCWNCCCGLFMLKFGLYCCCCC